MTARQPIHIDLTGPYAVDGRSARYQSVWLLARIWLAASRDREDLGVAIVRARFADAANVRMIVSRAFGDFTRWGVEVGWGHGSDHGSDHRSDRHKATDIAALRADRRSRGPFWMTRATARQLRFTAHGKALRAAGVARWLGQANPDAPAPPSADSDGLQYVMRDMDFWRHLTVAMRGAQDGFAGVVDHAVAESFRAAHRSAADAFQQALSLLKESLAWRRSDRLDKSRAALRRFEKIVAGGRVNAALPTFAAMAHVVRAWEHYTRGDLDAARHELARLAGDPELRPVVRYNPRIRFETLNLEALIHKSIALRPPAMPSRTPAQTPSPIQPAARHAAARHALEGFSGALQAAYEADSVDAAQHAAANIGWSLWLFWRYGLVDAQRTLEAGDLQRQSMRWLGLSEWICDRFGVGGGSAWNTIFLLRVARGDIDAQAPASLTAFRARRPLTVAAAIDALRPFHAPFAPAKGFVRWSSVAAFALEEHDTGRVRYNALQLANLLLESAWYLTHEQGASAQAYAAMERLAAQLASLRAAERGFFHAEIRGFPPELRMAAAEAARS
ncbi:hypothetical protein FOB72_21015 [Cupriavidus pauculus]|uniref:Uncharacterized protein n=1 Tax=Cupriavidus pauculus TaxID=82633 RepID=A0A5P2HBZ6_9BURK|nr:hypothetical protein [Cupriavidus pauculus]QET04590.1 hypothetical protein FOB72_21015 [Cupriavidus pauculus]